MEPCSILEERPPCFDGNLGVGWADRSDKLVNKSEQLIAAEDFIVAFIPPVKHRAGRGLVCFWVLRAVQSET